MGGPWCIAQVNDRRAVAVTLNNVPCDPHLQRCQALGNVHILLAPSEQPPRERQATAVAFTFLGDGCWIEMVGTHEEIKWCYEYKCTTYIYIIESFGICFNFELGVSPRGCRCYIHDFYVV